MSSISPDGVRAELNNEVNKLKSGSTEFSLVKVTNSTTTNAALTHFTGVSSLADTAPLTLTLAAGAAASITTVGFLRVKITDSGGNITEGDYYIPFGTLA